MAEFVLIMQFLWLRIDDIIGKGLSVGIILELIFYFAITIIPKAIPISLLISSVLVFGDLSEKNELSSFKSAGVSLFRIMRGGLFLALFTAVISLLTSNFLRPTANYKFFYRLNAVNTQKAGLSFEEGVFNKDFDDYVIRIGEKDENGKNISDVLIYDHTGSKSGFLSKPHRNENLINLVSAKEGEMYGSTDGNYFIMKLIDGIQIREDRSEFDSKTKNKSYPIVRTKFKEWNKIFDLTQFDMEAMDLNLNRNKADLLNCWQLKTEIDSINRTNDKIRNITTLPFSKILNSDYTQESNLKNNKSHIPKSVFLKSKKPLKTYNSILDYYGQDNKKYIRETHKKVIRKKELFATNTRKVEIKESSKRAYLLRLNQQFSWALICIIFFFIGAPLGSIIRKGGYGYPLLISIVFFMLFIMLNIMGEKLNRIEVLTPILAAWLPCLVLCPFAIYLSYKSVIDAKLEDIVNPF